MNATKDFEATLLRPDIPVTFFVFLQESIYLKNTIKGDVKSLTFKIIMTLYFDEKNKKIRLQNHKNSETRPCVQS